MRIVVRWTRRVNHKSVFHNTNQFHKIKISLPKHKSISQHISQFTKTQTEQFLKTKTNFPKYKSVYQYTNQFSKTQTNFQNTNQFTKTQINFSKHKPISRNTKQKIRHLPCTYQRAWKGLIPRIFRLQHGDFYYALDFRKCSATTVGLKCYRNICIALNVERS